LAKLAVLTNLLNPGEGLKDARIKLVGELAEKVCSIVDLSFVIEATFFQTVESISQLAQ